MRALLVDALPLRRAGFERVIGTWATPHGLELHCVGAIPDQDELRTADYAIAIMTLSNAGLPGHDPAAEMEALRAISCPGVIISDEEGAAIIATALRCGIRAFLPTRIDPQLATEALNFVLAGGTFYPPSALLDRPVSEQRDIVPGQPSALTPRQQEVFRVLREGKSNKVIARQLRMRESTVKVHVRQIMRKLGAANRTQAALAQLSLDARSPTAATEAHL